MTPRLAVLVRDAATADLTEAAEWYEQRRVGLGVEFLRTARALLAGIGRAPLQFPSRVARSDALGCAAFRTWSTSSRSPRAWSSSPSCMVAGIRASGKRALRQRSEGLMPNVALLLTGCRRTL